MTTSTPKRQENERSSVSSALCRQLMTVQALTSADRKRAEADKATFEELKGRYIALSMTD